MSERMPLLQILDKFPDEEAAPENPYFGAVSPPKREDNMNEKKPRIVTDIGTLEINHPYQRIILPFFSVEHLPDGPKESLTQKACSLRTSYDIRLDQARDLAMILEAAIQELEE